MGRKEENMKYRQELQKETRNIGSFEGLIKLKCMYIQKYQIDNLHDSHKSNNQISL